MTEALLQPGSYVVAVSGGVDSMCLLHQLTAASRCQLVVAHFDHHQRPDSAADADLVRAAAARLGLEFVEGRAAADIKPDEDSLRRARYDFLETVRQRHGAEAIVTAHHQDDLLETILLHLLRGTNRRGLSPLQRDGRLRRPLLGVSKAALYEYARHHQLSWREDTTNLNLAYRRNYVRMVLVPRLTTAQRWQLLAMADRMSDLNRQIDELVAGLVGDELPRQLFNGWPHAVSREVMAAWLRLHGEYGYSRRLLDRLVIASKTLPPGKQVDTRTGRRLIIGRRALALDPRERYNMVVYG